MASVPVEVAGNLLILAAVLLGPFLSHRLERNLEAFLFVMGMAAVLVSRMLSVPLVAEALPHPIPITLVVMALTMLGAGFGMRRMGGVAVTAWGRWPTG
jgi:predicted cation transporter